MGASAAPSLGVRHLYLRQVQVLVVNRRKREGKAVSIEPNDATRRAGDYG